MVIVGRDRLHKAIDELSDESLTELSKFVAYLHFREQQSGSNWMNELYDLFKPVRDGAEARGMKETEIDQLLDDAIDEVRRERRG